MLTGVLLLFSVARSGELAAQPPQREAPREPFALGDFLVAPGEKLAISLPVAPLGNDNGTSIPVTVVNGLAPGPTLALIAGIHGSEYAPILAMQRLASRLDPEQLSGTVVIVHVANLPAFQGRTVYVGPVDQKNLNREFPGAAEGTLTQRIAEVLTRHVISHSDYLIDIHAGDANESLQPSYTAYYAEIADQELVEKSAQMALAFGLDTIVRFGGSYPSRESAIYTSAQAVTLGIPSIDVEAGERGRSDDRYVNPIVTGVVNVMTALQMLAGNPVPAATPLFINERSRVYSEFDGVWHPDEDVSTGSYVIKGSRLGVITDYHGRQLAEITAPESGILLILFSTPPVNRDDNLAVIGRLPD